MSEAAAARRLRLLVVDDEETQREMLKGILERAGYEVEVAANGREALDRLDAAPFDLLLSDQRMPVLDGLELLDRCRARVADMPVVLMTAYGSVSSAVQAMQRGAADYLTKPFGKDELLLVLAKVLEHRRLEHEVVELRSALQQRFREGGLVGRSPAMQAVYSRIDRVAEADVSVLIQGESGTGKELVARAIHARSGRRNGSFVALNCAAVPENLMESEFFGHEKGAFTGAHRAQPGRFEQAHGGTLFLDEVGAMRVDLQAKLLRAIQEREIQRLGASRVIGVDVRLVAATSEDLAEAMQKGTFRDDLYYRLNVVPIELPALRDRAEDVPLLVDHFLRQAGERLGRPAVKIGSDVVDRMQAYSWPGNVRELQNCVERMLVLSRGPVLGVDDLPPAVQNGKAPGSECLGAFDLPADGVSLSDLERHLMVQALRRARGSLGPAARLLGISYKTLQYRIRKHAITRDEVDGPRMG